MYRWRQAFEAITHYVAPNRYAIEIPLYATRIPCGIQWKVKQTEHTVIVYGEAPPRPINVAAPDIPCFKHNDVAAIIKAREEVQLK